MSIRFSNHTDIPKLRHIMQVVFGDHDLFLDRFFHYKFNNNALIYEIDHKIVSVAFLLPALLDQKPITYIYGCATLPEFRGTGIMKKLLEEAYRTICNQNHIGLCLVPASKPLFQYYYGLGFQDYFFHSQSNYQLTDTLSQKSTDHYISPIHPEEYTELRNSQFSFLSQLQWDYNHFKFVQEEYISEKGGFFTINHQKTIEGIGFFYTHNFKTYIPELLTDLSHLMVAQLFFNYLESNYIEFTTPGKDTCFGLIRWNENIPSESLGVGYLAFALE